MNFPALIISMFASAAPANVPASAPITVTGHAWAPFISPMGEPFRARTVTDDTLANWFGTADTNHDGVLTVDEMKVDAERFFAKIDTDHNGEVDPDELAAYEWDIAPDIQVSSRTRNPPGVATPQKPAEGDQRRSGRGRWRPGAGDDDATLLGIGEGLQGAARYGLLNMPEPVAAADTNFDRVVTLSEFRQAAIDRFNMLDRSRSGSLTLAQLQAMRPPPPKVGRRSRPDFNAGDKRVGNPLPPGD